MKKQFVYKTKIVDNTVISVKSKSSDFSDWLVNTLGLPPGKILLITDDNVAKNWLKPTISSVKKNGFKPLIYILGRGSISDESVKSLTSAEKIYKLLLRNGFNRSHAIVALGGGVVGDLAAFCASTFHRGIQLIHYPTSLLAQVDSSIGGKTALHFHSITNVIGTYYQPLGIYLNVDTLETLSNREFISGLAEIVKIGLIADRNLIDILEKNIEKILNLNRTVLEKIVYLAAKGKAMITSKDPREENKRLLLNFGHTVGQALETVGKHQVLRHGEAVSIGMSIEARIGVLMKITSPDYLDFQDSLLRRFNLPTDITGTTLSKKYRRDALVNKIQKNMLFDKKIRRKKLRFIVPVSLGSGKIVETNNFLLVSKALSESFRS